jgi:hypothetical protein
VCTLLLASGCAPTSDAFVDVHERVAVDRHEPIDVRLLLQPEHRRDASRYTQAAVAAVDMCTRRFGGFRRGAITLVDPDWHGHSPAAVDATVLPRVRWWSTSTAMAPELAAARAVSRRCWSDAASASDLPAWFTEGLAEFSARRVVAPFFHTLNVPPGYAFVAQRYFDGFVPRFLRMRMLVETDGWPLTAYHAHQDVSVADRPRTEADGEALTGKTVLVLGTLERWLGRPVVDGILATFADECRRRPVGLADFERVASDASGQELSWFFDQTLRSSAQFDYGIDQLTSDREADGWFVTKVRARRYGDAQFTGTSAGRVGPFENGRGVVVMITFVDGRRRNDYWDGRDREKVFRYRSQARAVSAVVDPERTLLLDLKRVNNSLTLVPSGPEVASSWAVRYGLWLQNLLLTYASIV